MLDAIKLEKSETIGRVLRLDDISVIGTSSQTLAEAALDENRPALAADLVSYFHTEMDIMKHIMNTWIQDTLRYIVEKSGTSEATAVTASTRHDANLAGVSLWRCRTRHHCLKAIEADDHRRSQSLAGTDAAGLF